jgi:hypothetical protein
MSSGFLTVALVELTLVWEVERIREPISGQKQEKIPFLCSGPIFEVQV